VTLRVRFGRPPEGEFATELHAVLPPGIEVVDGACDVFVAGTPTREELEESPDLRAVVIPYAGVPARTRELLAEFNGVSLHNLHHNAGPTAETALALMLAAAKRVIPIDRALRAHDWRPRYEERARGLGLEDRTAVILGYGEIGQRIGEACRALGMHVIGLRRESHQPLSDALPRAHVLFVCVPWTPATDGIVGARELALLPDGAVLVNVGRGPLVDEEALYEELRSGRISAGLDVWYRYPRTEVERENTPVSRFPFHELDNVVMSPHRAGHADTTERLRARHLAELLLVAEQGRDIPNRVDLEAGY
jgi:phosphoglycerate dehydrogenase-like enzyme